MTIQDIFTIHMSFALKRYQRIRFQLWKGETVSLKLRLCVWSARGALGEGAAHWHVATHIAIFHTVNFLWCGAYTRHGALGVRAAHRASKQIFTTTSSKIKSTQLFLLRVSLINLAIAISWCLVWLRDLF